MKKNALTILGSASLAALLLVWAALRSPGYVQPHPYIAAAWLAAILAFGIFSVMLLEYTIHGRQTHLYLGATFLSLGIIGVCDALLLPSAIEKAGADTIYLALWRAQWITLALMLITGLFVNRGLSPKRHVAVASIIIAAGIFWAGFVVFLLSIIPSLSNALSTGRTGTVSSVVCIVIFALACFAYTRQSIHRSNAVLWWTGYGLIFAAFAELAVMSTSGSSYGLLFGFASIMKVLTFLFPLIGMLAEHSRLQLRLADQASEMNNLVQVQQAVASAIPPADLYERLVELVSFSYSGAAVCLMPFDKDRGLLSVAASTGLDDEVAKRLIFRPGEGSPGDAYSSREVTFVRDIFKDPTLAQKLDGVSGIGSAAFAALVAKNECLGVMAVFFGGAPKRSQKLQKEQIRTLEAFAGQAAIAVEGTLMRSRMLDTARATDDHTREMEIIWEIGKAVTSKLSLNELVDTLAEKLRFAVGAKSCSVLVYDADAGGLRITGNRSMTRRHSINDHVDQCDRVAATVAETGECLMANNLPNSCHCKYPELVMDDEGVHHLLSVPMSLRGFLGAISVFRQNSEPFGEREKRLLLRLAPMVAAGIRNAELYEREKRIAENLQSCFMPTLGSGYQELEVSTLYEAAFDESLVGGDFYDLTDFGNGKYGIAIGDVSGKGLDAAVYTAMARYMIQAYSSEEQDPLRVVSRLNGALDRYMPSNKFVTLVYGVIDTKSNTFRYVNAGHEHPFIHKADAGKLLTLKTTGPAAGALADTEYTTETLDFEPGDSMILYTDGASDARNGDRFLGTEGLQKIVETHLHRGAGDLPTSILSGIKSFSDERLRDDVAIVVIKYRKPGSLF